MRVFQQAFGKVGGFQVRKFQPNFAGLIFELHEDLVRQFAWRNEYDHAFTGNCPESLIVTAFAMSALAFREVTCISPMFRFGRAIQSEEHVAPSVMYPSFPASARAPSIAWKSPPGNVAPRESGLHMRVKSWSFSDLRNLLI
jgi:hypothetical protein